MKYTIEKSILPICACMITLLSCMHNSKEVGAKEGKSSCDSIHNYQNNSIFSIKRKNIQFDSEKIKHVDEITINCKKIEISTNYINDTLAEEEAWDEIKWPIIENQFIIFKHNDSVVNTFLMPTKQIIRTTNNNIKVRASELVIWQAAILVLEHDTFFLIGDASWLCQGSYCPTYEGLFKLSGEPIYQVFRDENKQATMYVGKNTSRPIRLDKDNSQLNDLYKDLGITSNMLSDDWKNKFCVGILCK